MRSSEWCRRHYCWPCRRLPSEWLESLPLWLHGEKRTAELLVGHRRVASVNFTSKHPSNKHGANRLRLQAAALRQTRQL